MGIRTVVGFVLKELIQLRRDPKIVSILFIAPIVQLTILGYAATTDVRQIELVVCDLDHSAASRLVVDAFTASAVASAPCTNVVMSSASVRCASRR